MRTAYEAARARVVAAGRDHDEPVLDEHEGGALGVEWNSRHAQEARFTQLARVLHGA